MFLVRITSSQAPAVMCATARRSLGHARMLPRRDAPQAGGACV
jgi:hypothetical protein